MVAGLYTLISKVYSFNKDIIIDDINFTIGEPDPSKFYGQFKLVGHTPNGAIIRVVRNMNKDGVTQKARKLVKFTKNNIIDL